jgi:oxygen-independent coproporphyrinogen-3 oxidase
VPLTSASLEALPPHERLRDLVRRHDRPVPRYTSYPTAPLWSEAFGEAAFRDALRQSSAPEISVYVHVPFCERLCAFCACNRKITRDHGVVDPYLEGIEREASEVARELGMPRHAAQLALGGGSPNFLRASELARLLAAVDLRFPPAPGAERSVELDPRGTGDEQMEVLAARGFNRVSLGVQDTSPRVQQAIRRIQPEELVARLVSTARRLGMRSINFDLIYGLPFQTLASFDDTLDRVLALRPDRIALYSYAHVTWISKAQRSFEERDLPGGEQKVEIFLLALERLGAAGYRAIGLDHFALPHDELARAADSGDLRRNFMGYSTRTGLAVAALGPSGISALERCYAQSARDPDEWLAAVRASGLATRRGCLLSVDDRRRGWLIQQLMCRGVIDPEDYAARFGEPLRERIRDLYERLAPFEDDGLLVRGTSGWSVTPLGRLFLRPIATVFDAYLEPVEPAAGARRRFSRSV